ncbi:hypothetical protein [Pseudomonas syringae]|uniref:hypothetical protein n=1 Tax=Pseudomonas syringae TaxID=317 RepID=UPI0004E6C839|nr:hypothetical protein [Pseudomonas syringae]KFF85806.1 hypothetical protein HM80_00885 [Pseudomonas syringae pv. syringae]MBS7469558.1 hypothetical protein [Pseudomonas syringae]RMN65653.1 hypothetical protein ALQ54_00450 [Pseudomonas syringae]
MIKKSKEEIFIKKVFHHFGFDLEKIGESDTKSPDFLTSDGQYKILLELKTKNESQETLDERDTVLKTGEIYSKTTPLHRNNRISKLFDKAAKQFHSKKETVEADFCFLILHACGPATSYHLSQFEASAYGSVKLITYGITNESLKDCYYFQNSDFYKHQSIIDGAIFVGENNLQFCINDLSPRYDAVKKCGFVKAFTTGVVDPTAKETAGKAYSIRTNIDRNDEYELIEHIKKKYSIDKVIPFNFIHQILITRIAASEEE